MVPPVCRSQFHMDLAKGMNGPGDNAAVAKSTQVGSTPSQERCLMMPKTAADSLSRALLAGTPLGKGGASAAETIFGLRHKVRKHLFVETNGR